MWVARPVRPCTLRRAGSTERIADAHAIDGLAVLQVLGQQDLATGRSARLDDQRIPVGQTRALDR